MPDYVKKTESDYFSIERISIEGDSTKEEENRDCKHTGDARNNVKVVCDHVNQLVSHKHPKVSLKVYSDR